MDECKFMGDSVSTWEEELYQKMKDFDMVKALALTQIHTTHFWMKPFDRFDRAGRIKMKPFHLYIGTYFREKQNIRLDK